MGENIVKSISNNQSGNIMDSFIELFGELLKSSKIDYNGILKILKNEYELASIIARLTRTFNIILQYNDFIANKLISMDKRLLSSPTKEEIAEIVNKAISSYNEANKKSIEELNKQSVEEVNKNIDASSKKITKEIIKRIGKINKQNSKETKVRQAQIIQMCKELVENVNKLNNKVDRLESILQKKEITERATQSTVQTFANGLHSSKKIYINNILNEDLEQEDNVLNNKKLGDENIANKKENNKTPLHTSEVNDTILEDITNEKNQRPTIKRQVVIDDFSVDKTRIVNEENKNIDKPKVNESCEKLDLKIVMKESRKTTVTKYKEKVGNDYTKEQFKNNKEIGIGCKHRAFLRFDGKMTSLSKDIFEKDTKLEKDTYYFERGGQKYLVFRNIDSANVNVPNDSFTLMKLPEGCQKIDNNIVVDILNKARIDGIDGENSILIDSIEELQGLVVADEKIKTRYFDETKNRRVCSLLSSGDLMKTYTSEFEKGCKKNEITNYKDYMPFNDGQLEFRSKKEIDNGIYIKPYIGKVNGLPTAMQEKKKVEYTEQVENLTTNSFEENEKLKEKLKMYNSLNKNFNISEQKLVF